MSNDSSDEKKLRLLSFAAHAARGVIRDQNVRRRVMLGLILIALLLVILGATVLESIVSPKDHLGLFISFWVVCCWFTATALLLAVFDLLMLKRDSLRARRELEQTLKAHPSSPRMDE